MEEVYDIFLTKEHFCGRIRFPCKGDGKMKKKLKKLIARRLSCLAIAGTLIFTCGIDHNPKKEGNGGNGIAYASTLDSKYKLHRNMNLNKEIKKFELPIEKRNMVNSARETTAYGVSDIASKMLRLASEDNKNTEVEISYEEKLETVLNYLELGNEEYESFAQHFLREAEKLGYGFTSIEDITDKFYDISQVSIKDKMQYIMDITNLSYDELNTIAAIFPAEGKYGYIDVYGTATTLFNRTYRSKTWITCYGSNLYNQVISPSQYCAFADLSYLQFLGKEDHIGYKAVVDALYLAFEGYTMHSYLSFTNEGEEQFVPGGAWYRNEITYDDLVEQYVPSGDKKEDNDYVNNDTTFDCFDEISKVNKPKTRIRTR